jgi:hypothetical protein
MAPRKVKIPRIMDKPSLLRPGEDWTHACPASTAAKPCSPQQGIQGGEPGMRAHLRTAHPDYNQHVRCTAPCPLDIEPNP